VGFRTILVHLDGQPQGAAALQFAAGLARRFDAHLAAVFACDASPLMASALDPAAAMVLEYEADAERALMADACAQVTSAAAANGLPIEWRTTSGDAAGNLIRQARYADVLVMTRQDPELFAGTGPALAARVVLGAGRPVLLLPGQGEFPDCGASTLLGWNAGRESARAAADALPFLRAAREVHVASFTADAERIGGGPPRADVGLWLARHAVRATVHERRAEAADVGRQLWSLAASLGSDLVVLGAYGHSRAYEMVLGGATRTTLRQMAVPVLMSH